MPELSRFFGIVITMFYNEHHPPHFHAKYGGHRVIVNIETGQIMEGSLPTRAMALVREWHGLHSEERVATARCLHSCPN